MRPLRGFALLAAAALSSPSFAAGPPAAPAPNGLPQVCLDVSTGDRLTEEFAQRLRKTLAASGAVRVASAPGSCSLKLHVPGNLLRFESAGGIMVSTVVIVTSASDRYLSTSISACQATDLQPCAVRAVGAAKLALMETANGGK